VLAAFGYDDLGRRTSLVRGNGAVTSYQYDPVSRLGSMTHDFAAATHDLTLSFDYNPASQIVSTLRSNDLYAWTGHGSGTSSSTAKGSTGWRPRRAPWARSYVLFSADRERSKNRHLKGTR
jgi:YD repeat-containing protein